MSDILELTPSAPSLVRSRVVAYWELTKPGIAAMVLVATSLGFYLALPAGAGLAGGLLLLHTLIGIGLVGGGSNALNQYIEAPYDERMARTIGRPVPSGRVSGREALAFGALTGIGGVVYLALLVNGLSAALGAFALLSYVLLYTPLKRVTSMCVFVGAVPGALPPVIGWAAAADSLPLGAWLLFAILFFWQLPHFAAIAWLYREDYARAGYPMLPVVDPEGLRTTMHVVTHTVALITASLLPVFYGLAGGLYAAAAVALGLTFLASGCRFVAHKTSATARGQLLVSLIYLPLLVVAMMADKTPLS